jgi:hypothetical protein
MDEIVKPFLSNTTLSPKCQCLCEGALAPVNDTNQTPNITFGNSPAETLRFAGGFNIERVAGFEYFCPSY